MQNLSYMQEIVADFEDMNSQLSATMSMISYSIFLILVAEASYFTSG